MQVPEFAFNPALSGFVPCVGFWAGWPCEPRRRSRAWYCKDHAICQALCRPPDRTPSARDQVNRSCLRGFKVFSALRARARSRSRTPPDGPCSSVRVLLLGLAVPALLSSFDLAFRHVFASRAANRFHFRRRLCLPATHPRTAASRRHFLRIFWHFAILSVRIADKPVQA